jgi:hypothetical protein
MKVVAVSWIALLVVFALLQLNDPDPWRWVLVYLAAALLWTAMLFDRKQPRLEFALLLIMAFWMGGLWPGVLDLLEEGKPGDLFAEMATDRPYIEVAREFLGLAIAAISVSWLVGISRGCRGTTDAE